MGLLLYSGFGSGTLRFVTVRELALIDWPNGIDKKLVSTFPIIGPHSSLIMICEVFFKEKHS